MSKSRNERRNIRPDGRRQRLRNISVRSVRRDPPDARKLGRAIIRLALAEADAERAAQAAHAAKVSADPAPAPASPEARG